MDDQSPAAMVSRAASDAFDIGHDNLRRTESGEARPALHENYEGRAQAVRAMSVMAAACGANIRKSSTSVKWHKPDMAAVSSDVGSLAKQRSGPVDTSALDPSRAPRLPLNPLVVGETRGRMHSVSLSGKRSHWQGATGTLDCRTTSQILTAFAKSVSPHSYKGRMKSDWVWIARPLRSRHFRP